jgi:site-specific recombinase XerD
MLFKKEEFLNQLSKGLSRNTVQYTEIYIDQFYLWLIDKGITNIKEVTSKTIHSYQEYLIDSYRKKTVIR